MPFPFVGDIDMSKIHFVPTTMDSGKQRIEIYKDANVTKHNRLVFNLTPDPREPFGCRYKLDAVRDDQDGTRRGLIVKIENEDTLRALRSVDEQVVQYAVKNMKECFGKKHTLTEAEVRQRYRPLVFKANEEDDFFCTKFKVKCGNYQTRLHLLHDDDTVEEAMGRVEHIEEYGAFVAPILNVYALWFMGGGSSFGVTIQADDMFVRPGKKQSVLSKFCSRTPLKMAPKRSTCEESEQDWSPTKRARTEVASVELDDVHDE